ncbi:putative TIM-barrel fold metal-dependent hydrolase [Streptomyces sp. SAI-117]|jgi:aminocarboxymuconate-semialdehyde decarboxylase|uniref:amidohydrolase family protein n=1 Tax=unclassified Streptomyces TaxID=2593676 RepID=UPI0024764FA2|nr:MULTISPECIES: amidohydrolase family protein [unclassified Streptomyces]MDH6545925.1 putative TIM-barrel fold metal-dependent hydrolase [Streptomyces sp. SAI-041]MDH6565028.1 putative TIM-barrel fold metal-dependent hydrolase [Streptomyces sp. SAI-117]MDH6589992.1 putative TIM-barrel fold metal-dependent hydrolase [Streptomyces sp. SAI-133]
MSTPVVDFHGHAAVPAADALVAGTPGLAAELAAEQRAHSPASLAANRAQLQRLAGKLTSVEERLADLDAMGVDVQVVGPMPMHHYWAEPDLAARLARTVNEAVAAHCGEAPERLYGLGTVPLQHPDLAVALLDRAVTELGLYGIGVSTSVEGRELADPAHDDVWRRAEELGAVVFVHPWGCSLGERLASHYLGNTVGQPVETTVALSHLIFSGVLDRFPRLKLVAAHGGGYLPTYIGRSDHAWRVRGDARGCAEPPSSYLRRMWFDALVYTPSALRHLVEEVGADRVVLGTDHPFDMGVDDPLARLDAAGLAPADRAAIAGGNALDLLLKGRTR